MVERINRNLLRKYQTNVYTEKQLKFKKKTKFKYSPQTPPPYVSFSVVLVEKKETTQSTSR